MARAAQLHGKLATTCTRLSGITWKLPAPWPLPNSALAERVRDGGKRARGLSCRDMGLGHAGRLPLHCSPTPVGSHTLPHGISAKVSVRLCVAFAFPPRARGNHAHQASSEAGDFSQRSAYNFSLARGLLPRLCSLRARAVLRPIQRQAVRQPHEELSHQRLAGVTER